MIKGIIFDFDGVILESVDVKTRAFAALFKNHPEHVEEIVRFHVENGGMNRYRKFEFIFREILRIPLADAEKERLGMEFSNLVTEGVINAPFVPGAENFLNRHQDDYLMFVVSGTPEDELREIVARRKLTDYFREVLGSPTDKAGNIKKIMECYHLASGELVFVGDALADYEGAQLTGVPFIGRVTDGTYNPFAALDLSPVICDLSALGNLLLKMQRHGSQ